MAAFVQIERLGYRYPQRNANALTDVCLEIQAPVTRLSGNSGSGKSTLLRLLCGLVPHFHGGTISGIARVAGMDILRTTPRELSRQVGFLFQDAELQTVRPTVTEDVAFGLENRAMPRAQMQNRVDEALHLVGLAHLRHRNINTLSGGERQRLALAGIIALQPPLLALDEPTSQLDEASTEDFRASCTALLQRGSMIILAEHRKQLLLSNSEIRIGIDEGRISSHNFPQQGVAGPQPMTPQPGDQIWAAHRLSVGLGKTSLLEDVEISGAAGEVIIIRGANGSGKTTFLRTLAGFIPPLAGEIARRPQSRIAYLPQNPASLLHLETVDAEIKLTLRQCRMAYDLDTLCSRLGLEEVRGYFPRDLSCGQRQRAAVAAVLAGRPALAILDEPTRGMDEPTFAAFVEVIRSLQQRGMAIVIATHDRLLAETIGDRIWEITDHRLLNVSDHSNRLAVAT